MAANQFQSGCEGDIMTYHDTFEEFCMQIATPSAVMFDDIHDLTKMTNKEMAIVLLTDKPVDAGRSPRQRAIEQRSTLTRMFKQAEPGERFASFFNDLSTASLTLFSRMLDLIMQRGGVDEKAARKELETHYAGEAATAMCNALEAYEIDPGPYRNALEQIRNRELFDESDRAPLYLMLFVATGCLGDPRQASDIVEGYVNESGISAMEFNATTPFADSATAQLRKKPGNTRLGIVQLAPAEPDMRVELLSTDPEGTVLGRDPGVAHCLYVGDGTVSRRHLRIWRDSAGHWFAQDLGSKHGTKLVRADTGETLNVGSEGVEVFARDILALGSGVTRLQLLGVGIS